MGHIHLRFDKELHRHVVLVWGRSHWQVFPDSLWPPGTVEVNGHLETPLLGLRQTYFTDLHLPAQDTLNWGLMGVQGGQKWWMPLDSRLVGSVPDTLFLSKPITADLLTRQVEDLLGFYAWEWLPPLGLLLLFLGWTVWSGSPASSAQLARFRLPDVRRNHHSMLYLATAISLMFLVWTGVFTLYFRALGESWDTGGWAKHILVQGSLRRENVLAVWWSSVLLFLVGILALLVGTCQAETPWWVRFSWWILGLGFVALSADEQGSIHERVFMLRYLFGKNQPEDDGIPVLLILAGIAGLSLLPGWWHHFRSRPSSLAWFVAGILFLLSVPIQEEIEMSLVKAAGGGPWQRPIWHILVEEGSELAGSICFLASLIPLVGNLLASRSFFLRRQTVLAAVGAVFALLAVGVPVSRLALEQVLRVGDTGRLSHWFPAVAALVAAWLTLWAGRQAKRSGQKRWHFLLLAAWALILSCFHGANIRIWGELTDWQGHSGAFWAEAGLLLCGWGGWLAGGRYAGFSGTWSLLAGLAMASATVIFVLSPGMAIAADVAPALFIAWSACLGIAESSVEKDFHP